MKAELLRCRQLLQGRQVVCALSGGGDSVALLHGLWSVKDLWQLRLSAAHFHHGLRQTADRDEAFVRDLCARLQIPLTVEKGDALAYAKAHGMSVEEGARALRYEFLLRQEGLIAVAHHADDQVETVLINLLRGTGLKGLGGMTRQTGRIVRPLLGATKEQIEQYLQTQGLSFCTDETNEEDDALRNRLRHHVVPLLKQENPALTKTVSRMTALLQEDEALLSRYAEELLQQARVKDGYDCRVLSASPLCSRAVRRLLNETENPSASHVQAVCELILDTDGTKQVQLPCMRVVREYEIVYFGKDLPGAPPAPVTADTSCAGSVLWGDWKISWEAFACGGAPLLIRSRQPSDTVHLPGGTKTVKKLLVDKKIPAEKRANLPIVVCRGEIVAVADLFVGTAQIKTEERKP
ncbi:MAG: tRNA lysidine(34) synthetase TilS [Oscillospiraceae bacterium]|nr:tRNA lysidine(34) synthetase TilS [Oscillospiraceae bacterium]